MLRERTTEFLFVRKCLVRNQKPDWTCLYHRVYWRSLPVLQLAVSKCEVQLVGGNIWGAMDFKCHKVLSHAIIMEGVGRELFVSVIWRKILTGVNEELVWDPRVINVMNSTGKNGSKNFEVCENSLWGDEKCRPKIRNTVSPKSSTSSHMHSI